MRARDQDGDLTNRSRQGRRGGEGFDELPDRATELREPQPGVPGANQGTITVDGLEALEAILNAPSHVIGKFLLFRAEIGWREERQTHGRVLRLRVFGVSLT